MEQRKGPGASLESRAAAAASWGMPTKSPEAAAEAAAALLEEEEKARKEALAEEEKKAREAAKRAKEKERKKNKKKVAKHEVSDGLGVLSDGCILILFVYFALVCRTAFR